MNEMKRYTRSVPLTILVLVLLVGCGAASQSTTTPAMPTDTSPPMVTDAPATAVTATQADPSTADLLSAFEGTMENIYTEVNPSVVSIRVVVPVDTSTSSFPGIPGFAFPTPGAQTPQYQQGAGSGFVWDKLGHIVTNNHVVNGADKIEVTFYDGVTTEAQVVGTDPDSDLAVIQVDVAADRLHPVTVADSSSIKVGQLALAIGNPFALENTMTVGIVSALGRSIPVSENATQGGSYTIPDIIQTDAPINPGNSGGVLVDDQGQLIGVTAAIESPVQANAGIGFAIPSAIVEKVVPALIDTGHYQHPRLGLTGTDLTLDVAKAMNLSPDQRGALIINVTPGGPADKAGLQGSDSTTTIDGQDVPIGGDVIVAVDGQPITSFNDVVAYLARNTEVGQTVTLTVLRQGKEQKIPVVLEARTSAATETPVAQGQTGAAWLGISGVTVTADIAQQMGLPSDVEGVLIQEVQQGSPADEAGLLGSYKSATINGQDVSIGGDIIIGIDNQAITSTDDLQTLLDQAQPGEQIVMTIIRDGTQLEGTVTLGTQPAN
jgi:serine protease Do